MPKAHEESAKALAKIRTQVAKLSGRVPVSRDIAYLTNRLADMKKAKALGEDVRHRYGHASVITSVSMPAPARDSMLRMASGELMNVSELVRVALGEWAKRNGYGDEVDNFLMSEEE